LGVWLTFTVTCQRLNPKKRLWVLVLVLVLALALVLVQVLVPAPSLSIAPEEASHTLILTPHQPPKGPHPPPKGLPSAQMGQHQTPAMPALLTQLLPYLLTWLLLPEWLTR
jgi:hypothetical protein